MTSIGSNVQNTSVPDVDNEMNSDNRGIVLFSETGLGDNNFGPEDVFISGSFRDEEGNVYSMVAGDNEVTVENEQGDVINSLDTSMTPATFLQYLYDNY